MKSILKKIYYQSRIQKSCIKIISYFYPPPYQLDRMEFKYDLWLGISSIHCEDGRQLGENNTGPLFLKEKIATDYHTIKEEGSRAGKIMNMSALHNVMRVWDEALGIINVLRLGYIKRMGILDERLSLVDIYILAKLCIAIPAYLARRSERQIKDGELPLEIAAQFQLISGIAMIVRKMMERGEKWLNVDTQWDADKFYDYAEKYCVFISPDDHVCGGTKRKIIELMSFSINGPQQGQKVTDKKSYLIRLVGDMDNFFDYASSTIKLELAILLCRAKAAEYFFAIDPEILLGQEQYKKNFRFILDHMHNYCPDDTHIRMLIENQIRIYGQVLSKLGQNKIQTYLSAVSKNTHPKVAPLKQLSSYPNEFNLVFSTALNNYKNILHITREFCENQQNYLNSLLGTNNKIKLKSDEVAEKLNIINHKELKKLYNITI